VFKAAQMMEGLRERRVALRVEDFVGMTACSRRTIYRILETLVACGYVIRDSGGYYRLDRSCLAAPDSTDKTQQEVNGCGRRLQADDQNVAFERWGIQFRVNGTRINTHSGSRQLAGFQVSENE
jgi:hypothetical protein